MGVAGREPGSTSALLPSLHTPTTRLLTQLLPLPLRLQNKKPHVISKGRKFEKGRGRRASKGFKV